VFGKRRVSKFRKELKSIGLNVEGVKRIIRRKIEEVREEEISET
jgi:hypothetical protein